MSPRLAILTGTLAGQTHALGSARLSLGRDARCDVHFDPNSDLDVSARHAELRLDDGVAIVRDCNSTNGVYVNGTRVRGEQRLAGGDVIRLGAHGPKIRFDAEAHPAAKASTTERIAVAVGHQTRALRLTFAAFVAVVICAGGYGAWSARRSRLDRGIELEALRKRNDSLGTAIDRDMSAMTGRLASLDSALAAARRESETLRTRLASERSEADVQLLSTQVARAESRRGAIAAAARMDYEAIAKANGPAVAMIAVEMPDGTMYSGSGVCVSADGLIVTNRHLVRAAGGATPRRIAVAYADTKDWLPARIERVAGDADLAVLRVERPGSYPFVSTIAQHAPDVGAPVAVIGFPLGNSVPMDGSTDAVRERSTLGVGTVSKSIATVLQIDGFAVDGSSGSPVFAEDGSIAGIVYGGAGEAAGRIIYAVPGSAVRALLK